MWLLNHKALAKFEIQQLRDYGIREIFTPKKISYDEANLSTTIDYTLDDTLSISQEDLAILNAQDWYGPVAPDAWEIANRYFQVLFIGFFPAQIEQAVRHFKGTIICRVFGLSKGFSYTQLLLEELGPAIFHRIRNIGKRFFWGIAYEHLTEPENEFFKERAVFLPIGLPPDINTHGGWVGLDEKVLFVCPRIASSPYYHDVYERFKQIIMELPHIIVRYQPLPVGDPNVVGWITDEEMIAAMKSCRLMFYHSTEPYHLHYHPLEAMAIGMPVVYMAGGLLDRVATKDFPGRAKSARDAKRKIRKILNGNKRLTRSIRLSQEEIIKPFVYESCRETWAKNFEMILRLSEQSMCWLAPTKRKRIAVILPHAYRGGTLVAATQIANYLHRGAALCHEEVDVVLGYPFTPDFDETHLSEYLHPEVGIRFFQIESLDREESMKALEYSRVPMPLRHNTYYIFNDWQNAFCDRDLWILISDRLPGPLLPLKPYSFVVFDYLQRYYPDIYDNIYQCFDVATAPHSAERVFVTTGFTRRDAIDFAGLPQGKVLLIPQVLPPVKSPRGSCGNMVEPYFLWVTNPAPHKNHRAAFEALTCYYQDFSGTLTCQLVGISLELLRTHFAKLLSMHPILSEKVAFLGELPEGKFQDTLKNAAFVFHPTFVDNGIFVALHASMLCVPVLSSDYPAMRELDDNFDLGLVWMDQRDPHDMASKLKLMEERFRSGVRCSPKPDHYWQQKNDQLAIIYWKAMRNLV